jgi:hypothetical protein
MALLMPLSHYLLDGVIDCLMIDKELCFVRVADCISQRWMTRVMDQVLDLFRFRQ